MPNEETLKLIENGGGKHRMNPINFSSGIEWMGRGFFIALGAHAYFFLWVLIKSILQVLWRMII